MTVLKFFFNSSDDRSQGTNISSARADERPVVPGQPGERALRIAHVGRGTGAP